MSDQIPDDQCKIIGYRTAAAPRAEQIDDQVAIMLEQGWQPYGFPFLTAQGNLAQVMVKYAPYVTAIAVAKYIEGRGHKA